MSFCEEKSNFFLSAIRATYKDLSMSSEQLAQQVTAMKASLGSVQAQLWQQREAARSLSAALAEVHAELEQTREESAAVCAKVAVLECQESDWTVLKHRRAAVVSTPVEGTVLVGSFKVQEEIGGEGTSYSIT